VQGSCGLAEGNVSRDLALGNTCPALPILEDLRLELADDADGVEHVGGVALGELDAGS
jgi:hypothetical protein